MFSEHDPYVILDIYKQVGKNKEILIETLLNGGEVPPQFVNNLGKPARQARRNNREAINVEEVNLDYLVDLDNHEVSEQAIQAQIARIE